MHQGNWTCSKCGGSITELPFEPRSNSGLTCRDCYFNSKKGSDAGSSDIAEAPADAVGSSDFDDRGDVPDFDPMMSGAAEPAPETPDFAEAPAASSERKMFKGDWACGTCGNAISQLPFEPRNTENLKCIDCFKQSKS